MAGALLAMLILSSALSPSLAYPPGLGPYVAPTANDNRSPCPAFNTMANHGVFPRDGSKIQRSKIVDAFKKYFAFAPALTDFIIDNAFASGVGDKQAGTIDLVQLRAHNKIEHDASLTRDDAFFGDHWTVNQTLVKQMVSFSNGKFLTLRQLGRYRKFRKQASVDNNPQFKNNELIALSEAAALAAVFGGRRRAYTVPVRWLTSFLRDEKYPSDFKRPLLLLRLPKVVALMGRLRLAAILPF